MIENDLDEIAERLRAITPANYHVDFGYDELYLIINWEKEKKLSKMQAQFFTEAPNDIARLIIEVKQLRQVNKSLKRQIVESLDIDD